MENTTTKTTIKSASTTKAKTAKTAKADTASNVNSELAHKYQKKTDKEHVLDNPETYTGSMSSTDYDAFITI